MDYREAGVDIDAESAFVKRLVSAISFERKDLRKAPIEMGFTGLMEFGDYYLALNTDGVGTKLLVAERMDKWDTVGIDCIAMNVNDTITVGAEPIAFVDYLAINSYRSDVAEQIGAGLNRGAELANVTILGGETATIPEMVSGIDLSGTSLGVVKKNALISGDRVQEGDLIFGVPSSGLHSNGFTLARKVFENLDERVHGVRVGMELLTPTRIYVREVIALLSQCEPHGMAHITGGGLSNILRVKKMKYVIDEPLEPQWIFREIQERAKVSDAEMYRTFNMGMGFTIIAPEECEGALKSAIPDSRVVGHVELGNEVLVPTLGLRFTPEI